MTNSNDDTTKITTTTLPESLEHAIALRLAKRFREEAGFRDQLSTRIGHASQALDDYETHDPQYRPTDTIIGKLACELAKIITPEVEQQTAHLQAELVRRTELLDQTLAICDELRKQVIAFSDATVNTAKAIVESQAATARSALQLADAAMARADRQRERTEERIETFRGLSWRGPSSGAFVNRHGDIEDLITIHVAHETFCGVEYHAAADALGPDGFENIIANIAGAFAAELVQRLMTKVPAEQRDSAIGRCNPGGLLRSAAHRFDPNGGRIDGQG